MSLNVMAHTVVRNKVYQRRVKTNLSFQEAICKAKAVKGYVVNDDGELVAQAMSPNAPRFVDTLVNISSGEDVL